MEKLIKIAKRIFQANVLIVTVIPLVAWLAIYVISKLGFYVFDIGVEENLMPFLWIIFLVTLALVVLITTLFSIILPFWVLKKRRELSKENKITKLHLFLLFTPLVGFSSWVFLWLLPTPAYVQCSTIIHSINYKMIQYLLFIFPTALILGVFLISLVLYFYKRRKDKVVLISLLILASLIIPLLMIMLGSLNSARISSIDGRRIADVKQMQLALEFYLDEFGTYPQVSGANPSERWQDLDILVSKGYIAALPHDRCADEFPEHQYDYKNSPNGMSYVLRAILDDQQHTALENDRERSPDNDGEIFGVWCGEEGNEREYCVVP